MNALWASCLGNSGQTRLTNDHEHIVPSITTVKLGLLVETLLDSEFSEIEGEVYTGKKIGILSVMKEAAV